MLRRFMIERDIPRVGAMSLSELGEAAKTSNGALAALAGIQWVQSYVAADKTFCIYLAEDEAVIRDHARLSGFPATRITELTTVIDPATEAHCAVTRTGG
ncbi:hypothetical protein ABIE65_002173 [Constrictibacter sp. MBR-5]|jgi:hypothetical protein|uniref:DUF4242 domain-containing protein n=1 Tax=Constrictibacter sp. MBR-5 TaxID=3156467 RepID=UPI0033947C6F